MKETECKMTLEEFIEALFEMDITALQFEKVSYLMALKNNRERFLKAFYDKLAEKVYKVATNG